MLGLSLSLRNSTALLLILEVLDFNLWDGLRSLWSTKREPLTILVRRQLALLRLNERLSSGLDNGGSPSTTRFPLFSLRTLRQGKRRLVVKLVPLTRICLSNISGPLFRLWNTLFLTMPSAFGMFMVTAGMPGTKQRIPWPNMNVGPSSLLIVTLFTCQLGAQYCRIYGCIFNNNLTCRL